MLAKSHEDVRKIYDSIETIKRLSDRIIGIGPIPLMTVTDRTRCLR